MVRLKGPGAMGNGDKGKVPVIVVRKFRDSNPYTNPETGKVSYSLGAYVHPAWEGIDPDSKDNLNLVSRTYEDADGVKHYSNELYYPEAGFAKIAEAGRGNSIEVENQKGETYAGACLVRMKVFPDSNKRDLVMDWKTVEPCTDITLTKDTLPQIYQLMHDTSVAKKAAREAAKQNEAPTTSASPTVNARNAMAPELDQAPAAPNAMAPELDQAPASRSAAARTAAVGQAAPNTQVDIDEITARVLANVRAELGTQEPAQQAQAGQDMAF